MAMILPHQAWMVIMLCLGILCYPITFSYAWMAPSLSERTREYGQEEPQRGQEIQPETTKDYTMVLLYSVVINQIWIWSWFIIFSRSLRVHHRRHSAYRRHSRYRRHDYNPNDLYLVYHMAAPVMGLLWYVVILVLMVTMTPSYMDDGDNTDDSDHSVATPIIATISSWMLYAGPFLFICPLGGPKK